MYKRRSSPRQGVGAENRHTYPNIARWGQDRLSPEPQPTECTLLLAMTIEWIIVEQAGPHPAQTPSQRNLTTMQYRITDFEPWGVVLASLFLLSGQALAADKKTGPEEASSAGLDREFRQQVRPLLERFCLKCHSSKEPEADIDLQKFGTFDEARHGVATWRKVAEILDKGEMPPPEARQPKGDDRQALRGWVGRYLDFEAHASAGDPGRVVLRRLSNVEYSNTIRDLTGFDLDPVASSPRTAPPARDSPIPATRWSCLPPCSPSISTPPKGSRPTPCSCPTASASPAPRPVATGPTRSSPTSAASTTVTPTRTASCRWNPTWPRPSSCETGRFPARSRRTISEPWPRNAA